MLNDKMNLRKLKCEIEISYLDCVILLTGWLEIIVQN